MKSIRVILTISILAFSTHAFGEVVALREIPTQELAAIKFKIINLSKLIYKEGLVISPEHPSGEPTTLVPVNPDLFDKWYKMDQVTGFSQIYLDEQRHVKGFLFAHPNEVQYLSHYFDIEIEKIA